VAPLPTFSLYQLLAGVMDARYVPVPLTVDYGYNVDALIAAARRERARVVVLRTFSKAMGMAGLRFGYALAHPDVAREIAKAKLPYNVNAITLAAAEVALERREVFDARTRAVVAERDRFSAALRTLPGLRVYPSAANFVLLRCESIPARTVFRRLLDEHGILVRDVSGGAGLAECLRISIGTKDDMDATLTALRGMLD
jgi:histidinol-phosphate aminotransferase